MKHFLVILISAFLFSGNSFPYKKPVLGKGNKSSRERREDKTRGNLLNEPLFTTSSSNKRNETSGIGVNTYLWKASLETLSFLPKKTVDPFGGNIITEWYSFPEVHNERLKIEVIIIGRTLSSEGVKVSIFREKKTSKGEWITAAVDSDTLLKFEETLLSRAREIKVAEEKNKSYV
ncbi:MAG: DUF3576 domain-containing protein [Alphaproteobacteria bacterium]